MSTTTNTTPGTVHVAKHFFCYYCQQSKPAEDYPPPKRAGDDPPGMCTVCVKRDTYFRESSCASKDTYSCIETAENAAQIAGGRRSVPLRVYPCDFGDHFHITKREDTNT